MTVPFVGANDGASSAAFLLEMARVLGRRRNRLTYWLVFFDGEEAVQRWSSTDSLYGSRHFASMLDAANVSRIEAVFVLDMIADAHLDIQRESHSTPWLNELLLAQAYRLGCTQYFLDSFRRVEDDHLPFVELGIPAVDIVDINYGPFSLYWHTRFDTVDKCSPSSLAIVRGVILTTLQVLEAMWPGPSVKQVLRLRLLPVHLTRDPSIEAPILVRPSGGGVRRSALRQTAPE